MASSRVSAMMTPLPRANPVGLDDLGQGGGFGVGEGFGEVFKHAAGGGGDVVPRHQVLGEDLAALDHGGVFLGAKAGDPGFGEGVHGAQHQRIVRRHHGEVDTVGLGEVHLGGDVLGADGHENRIALHAGVAGEGINRIHPRALFEGADDGMFAASAADDHELHGDTSN